MFEIGLGSFFAYAGIAFVLYAMEESGMNKSIVEGAAWTGYLGLAIGFLVSIMRLFI